MEPKLDEQLRMIVECLGRHRVSYVVIGGVAAMLQDVPIEETLDVDVVPERKTKNLRTLARALKEMEARLRIPGEPEGVEIPLDERTFRDVSTLTFITRVGPFDILFAPSGAPAYADLESRALVLRRFGCDIAVASIEDLIAMKRSTGREKDATHLTILLEFMRHEVRPE
ncbi:MAG: hypothetical protein M3345_00545 [Actinomycetota bacterium]|nr:hypothetical protein [Actinomycetota bacterium]